MLYSRKDARDLLMDQHRKIYEFIMSGDAEGARAAAQAHMRHVEQALRDERLSEARSDVSRRRLARWIASESASGEPPAAG